MSTQAYSPSRDRSYPPVPQILETIVQHKRQEVAQRQEQLPLAQLRGLVSRAGWAERGFLGALWRSSLKPSLIAEVKKASPSRGILCENFDPIAIAQAYVRAGAACVSVLTDERFFQGSFAYLNAIRQVVSCPLLCKDFIISPYQIYLARSAGADAILLIAAILSNQEIQSFLKLADDLGMTALVEVHTLAELDRVLDLSEVCLIGINNRDLTTFTVSLETTQSLMAARRSQIESFGITIVSESGLHTPADLETVTEAGAQAVLIGESLVKQPNIEQAICTLFHSPSQS